jgi:NADPH2:quinone reductase
MKAVIVDGYGPPTSARLGEIESPNVKDGHVLVQMRAASLNPWDDKVITGAVKDWVPISFPYVPGMDGAGVIAEIGKGVETWRKGDAVFGLFPKAGTLAEFATISATDKRLARKPDALDFDRAAAIPEAGLTALTLLRAADLSAGQQILIIGASGGIGLFATQLAKARGARVIATGKQSDAEYLRSLGADEVIDYTSGDPIAQVRQRYPQGVDVVIDVINFGEKLLPVASAIRSGGKLVSSLGGPDQAAFPAGVSVHYIQVDPQSGDLDDLAQRAASGSMKVEIGQTYGLDEAPQALADLEDPAHHTRGKLVVTIP